MEKIVINYDSTIFLTLANLDLEFSIEWNNNDFQYPVWGYNSFDDYLRMEAGIYWNLSYEITVYDHQKWCWFLLKWS